ncbi:hypothetical protein [Streptomyces sp. NPDC002889]|uniref:hypothetical protein n=1 Tax=Streptomyces sp. NPDC002889 TaxID=3364669 RepID=UPI0036A3C9D7
MSTVLIIVAVLAVLAVVVAAVFYSGAGRRRGRRGLEQRFGPEYDRALAGHDGDTKAAERELSERVERHGDLRPKPLADESRAQYVAQWAGLQEHFVDAPDRAVAEADHLLARLAHDRGFPEPTHHDEQLAALSVHHAEQVGGYRRLHRATRGQASTEELRGAMVEARALFDVLVAAHTDDTGRHHAAPAAYGRRGHSLKPKGSGA